MSSLIFALIFKLNVLRQNPEVLVRLSFYRIVGRYEEEVKKRKTKKQNKNKNKKNNKNKKKN